ncbi:MAG: hypothetical protein JSR46_03010 [Verrucomicrobia bacterium]|nr:hypothetical protein [Verrucomicrobiota bacterium]
MQEQEEHIHEESEDGLCKGCFIRHTTGAADVNNAKRRLVQGLQMQEKFLAKFVDHQKKPKTYETRKRLRDFFEETLEEFDQLFSDQLPEYADEEEYKKIHNKRRKVDC